MPAIGATAKGEGSSTAPTFISSPNRFHYAVPSAPVLRRRARWIPAVLYMALIFYASSQSDPAPVLTQNVWDKLLHAGGFAVLAALYVWALDGERHGPRQVALMAIVLTSLY